MQIGLLCLIDSSLTEDSISALHMKKFILNTTWLPNIAPQNVLIGCAFFVLLCIGIAVALAVYQPSLGITWTTTNSQDGLVIKNFHNDIKFLSPGDRIVSIGKPRPPPW